MIVAAGAAGAGSSAGAGAATSLLTAIGVGVGGIFVAVALILLLAYLNLLDASERDVDCLRAFATAAVVPLFVTFTAIAVFEALAVL